MKIKDILDNAKEKLIEAGKEEKAAIDLLLFLTRYESYELYDKIETVINEEIIERFEKGIDEYLLGTPIQHIIGYEMFFGHDFIVNEDVLIPRYETEELVENILYHLDDYFADYEVIKVADIGTGSGAIACTLALEESKTEVYATDISEKALLVAQSNNTKHDAGVNFLQGDMLEPLIYNNITVDVLVSNPPYIPQEQYVDGSVKDHEPNIALFGGVDGLDYYRIIFKNAKQVCNEKALLAFEFGFDQKEALEKLVVESFPNTEYQFLKDMNGKDRMLFVYFNIKK